MNKRLLCSGQKEKTMRRTLLIVLGVAVMWIAAFSSAGEVAAQTCTALPSRANAGDVYFVETSVNLRNRLRSLPDGPDIGASMVPGTPFLVMASDVCTNNRRWVQVTVNRTNASGQRQRQVGWTAEGDNTRYYIDPRWNDLPTPPLTCAATEQFFQSTSFRNTRQACANSTNSGEVCYGAAVTLVDLPVGSPYRFANSGDRVPLNSFQYLKTAGEGVALFRVLPEGQNAVVTFAVFGPTAVDLAAENYSVGRYVVALNGRGTCATPESGLLAQTPSGGAATIYVNGVEIQLASTVLITGGIGLNNGAAMVLTNLDGTVAVTANLGGVPTTVGVPVGSAVAVDVQTLEYLGGGAVVGSRPYAVLKRLGWLQDIVPDGLLRWERPIG
jgi:hypothetical protein